MSDVLLPVGVVGVGSLGFHHARLYAALPGARLVGVYDARRERADQVAALVGTRAFPTLTRLLDHVDAVSVVVPTRAHRDVAMAALARGRHVLVEKPLAETVPEAESLIEAADRAGVVLQTGHVERFNAAVRAVAPYLETPRSIQTERAAPFQARGSDVTVVLDLMIHDLDLVLALVREPVVSVEASGIGVRTATVDAATARLVFASGVVATLQASRLAPARVRRISIVQANGRLMLDLAAGRGTFVRTGADPADARSVAPIPPVDRPDAEPLALELESFVRAARTGTPPPVSGRDGLAALRLAHQIHDATALAPALAMA
ncbi:MAG: Gfo/Idh/MocA family oxidoreductase [Gemmatimonadota bacterium]